MLKALAKLVAYKKAPKRTFALLHPIRAVKWGAGLFLLKKLTDGLRGDKGPAQARDRDQDVETARPPARPPARPLTKRR